MATEPRGPHHPRPLPIVTKITSEMTVEALIREHHETVTSIRADLDKIMEVVSAIHEEVTPTLDALKSNPMLKMFFPKEGK